LKQWGALDGCWFGAECWLRVVLRIGLFVGTKCNIAYNLQAARRCDLGRVRDGGSLPMLVDHATAALNSW